MRGNELQRRRAERAEHDDLGATELVEHRDHVVHDALDQASFDRRVESDEPVPRGSNQMWRLNDDSPFRKRTNLGSSHIRSMGK